MGLLKHDSKGWIISGVRELPHVWCGKADVLGLLRET
jgi:hypothetical protein